MRYEDLVLDRSPPPPLFKLARESWDSGVLGDSPNGRTFRRRSAAGGGRTLGPTQRKVADDVDRDRPGAGYRPALPLCVARE